MITPLSPHTSDQLRREIDSGRSGDKVAFPDPAAAPLGTDDEAAGQPPTGEQVRLAASEEFGRTAPKKSSMEGFPYLYVLITLPVAIAILAALLLALLQRA